MGSKWYDFDSEYVGSSSEMMVGGGSRLMTREEFFDKVYLEGGWYEALIRYGLSENDLEENEPEELKQLIREASKVGKKFEALISELMDKWWT